MKVLLFACLFFLFQYSYQCLFRQKPFKPDCTIPANTIPVQLSQLTGVWYVREFANVGTNGSNYQCRRMEIVENSNGKSSVALELAFRRNGFLTSGIYELMQLGPDVIQYQMVGVESIKMYEYGLELDEHTYIAFQCYIANGKRMRQGIILMSTNQTKDTERLENRLMSLGVIVNDSYLELQYKNCFKFQPPA